MLSSAQIVNLFLSFRSLSNWTPDPDQHHQPKDGWTLCRLLNLQSCSANKPSRLGEKSWRVDMIKQVMSETRVNKFVVKFVTSQVVSRARPTS